MENLEFLLTVKGPRCLDDRNREWSDNGNDPLSLLWDIFSKSKPPPGELPSGIQRTGLVLKRDAFSFPSAVSSHCGWGEFILSDELRGRSEFFCSFRMT